MPDRILLVGVLSAAALSAAAILLLCALAGKNRPALVSIGTTLGLGLGFAIGCINLGVRTHWLPREDQDRLLLILLPGALLIELLAPLLKKWTWLLRFALAASATWVLLYGTVYLEDLAGPGSREWTPKETGLILSALAAALLAVWVALDTLAQRSGGRTVPLALAFVCGGASITVMLSGYTSGGLIGIPLAAAVVGVLIGSLGLSGSVDASAATSLALVGIFSLLVIGRFFGQLTTIHAAALLLAPLLCWLPELPLVRRMEHRQRNFVRMVLAAAPVVVVLFLAQQKFTEAASGPSAGSQEGSIDDFRSYGK